MTTAQDGGRISGPGSPCGSTMHAGDDRLDLPEHASGRDGEPAARRRRYTLRQFVVESCIAVTILLIGLPLVLFLLPSQSATPKATKTPASTARPMLFVSGGAVSGAAGDLLVAGGRGRFVRYDGNGFAAGPEPLARSAPATAAESPFLDVVVQGGEADVSQPPRTVEVATLHMIDRLRAQIDRDSSITIVGPIPDAEPGAGLLRVRDELAAATAEKGVRFIDPIQHGLGQGQPDLRQQLENLLRGQAP